MKCFFLSILVLLICVGNVWADRSICGTSRFLQQNIKHRAKLSLKIADDLSNQSICTADDYYDSVYVRKTEHFQIFYTLDGPHQTTEAFIDSLVVDAEYAWNFHKFKMGLLPPKGEKIAFHYQQPVDDELYPIEVIDVDLLRNSIAISGGPCNGCFGLTFQTSDELGRSELVIDNDFLYTRRYGGPQDTIKVNGKTCTYKVADQELRNDAHDYSYADHWEKALRVTAIHEIYHGFQLRYFDLNSYFSKHYSIPLWFEASASGVEELAAPDIDDYVSYLKTMFNHIGESLDSLPQDYGVGIFLIYLYNHIDTDFENFFWTSFSKNPNATFQDQFKAFVAKKKLSADSIFNDFATRLSFSGSRTSFVDSTYLITNDQKIWPDFNYVAFEDDTEIFDPHFDDFSYRFYTGSRPDFEKYKGSASLVLYKSHFAEIHPVTSTNQAQELYSSAGFNPSVDSIAWILSRLDTNAKVVPTHFSDSSLHAYPMPWRGGKLCFAPLPENKKFIEIRSRRGDLITRIDYDNRIRCIDESTVRSLMIPGIYRFRAGSYGKTKDFLIIY